MSAQPGATLSGRVTGPNQSGLEAAVRVSRLGAIPVETSSGEDGRYELSGLDPGPHTVRIEAQGLRTVERRMDLKAGSNLLDITLDMATVAETITVTAQKREEEASKAPVSITVLDSEQVERNGLKELRAVPDLVPNFRVTDTGGRATFSYITLRGFLNNAGAVDPSTVFYVDGVPFGDFYAINQPLFDVERIEVVKGPQSTLYGVNSQAGVVNVYSKRPGNDLHGSLTAGFGTFKSRDTVLALSGPLVRNKLYASFSASTDGRDGFLRNLQTGRQYDDQFGYGGRARVVWNPTAQWDIVGTAFLLQNDDISSYQYMPTNRATYSLLPGVDGRAVGPFDIYLDNEGFNRQTTSAQSLQISRYGHRADFIYTGSHRQSIQHYGMDGDLTPLAQQNGVAPDRFYQWYHEARLQSPREGSGHLQWTLGFSADQLNRRLRTILELLPANFYGAPAGSFDLNNVRLDSRNYGAFTQGTYRIWHDRVGVTAGLRYDTVSRDYDAKPGFFGFPGMKASASDHIWLPKVAADLRAGAGVMLYATAGRGWRAGGFNPFPSTVATARYAPEKSWSYEGGIKAQALNNRIYGSLAVFVNDVRGFHDVIFAGPFLNYLGNVRAVTLRGADVEVGARPARGWELTASLGLTRARYDDYLYDTASGLRFDGRRIRQIPRMDYSAAAHYRFSRWPLFARAEMSGIGDFKDYDVNVGAGTIREFTFGKYTVFNLRMGYDLKRWSVVGYVNNIADRAYFTNTTRWSLTQYPDRVGVLGARRVAGVRVTFRF